MAKDFIRKLLVVTPEERLSARAALNHPWITGDYDTTRSSFISYQNIKDTAKHVSLSSFILYLDNSMDVNENDCIDIPSVNNDENSKKENLINEFSHVMPYNNIFTIANFFISKLKGFLVYNKK